MNEIITAEYFEGQGCTCEARSSYECGCEGADWTPKEVYDLRGEVVALKAFAESTANLAKSLKAERDEVMEKHATEATEHMLAINKICGERDEARTGWDQEITFNQCQLKDARQLADRLTALELHSTSELARLELERDEALSQIAQAECRAERFCQERDEANEELHKQIVQFDQLFDEAEKIKNERNEAREKIERQADRIRYLEGATNHACGTPLSVALRERDEARNDIVGWENKWKCAVDMAARAELERDEALKCAKEYYVEFIRNASSDNKVSKPNPLNPFYKY